MRKILTFSAICAYVLLSGCTNKPTQNSATAFMLDTVVNITAQCDKQTINDTLNFCRELEGKLSRTDEVSTVYMLNKSGSMTVDDHTAYLIKRAGYYSELTDGRFDITVYPLSKLWDFKNGSIPSDKDIAMALKSVGYEKIEQNKNEVRLNGTKIDLGGIAKGYISFKAREYLEGRGVENAVLNFGGNIVLMGDEYREVEIKNPFKDGKIATLYLKDTSIVTSGTYERFIEKDGKKYHHILDPDTGYPCDSDVVSATIICKNPTDADALSTACVVLGCKEATNLIDRLDGVEAVFVTIDGKIHTSSGIYCKDGYYRL